MQVYEMCLSHVIRYRNVSIAVGVMIRLIYNITRSHKRTVTMHKWTAHCEKYVSNFLSIHGMSAYLLKSDKIQFLEKGRVYCLM